MADLDPTANDGAEPALDLGDACETARRELHYRNLPAAAALADKVLLAFPDSTSAHELLGDVLMAQGKRTTARAAFKRAMEIEPANADAERKYAEATLYVEQADRTRQIMAGGDLSELRGAGGKDASAAATRSLFFPGLGQLYNGEYEKGLITVGVGLPLFGLALWGLVEMVTAMTVRNADPVGAGQMALAIVGIFGYGSLLAWSVWDAHHGASSGGSKTRDGAPLPPS